MVNLLILQGRLVRDPELQTTSSGITFARFTVAWSEKYKETETKLFLDCTAWRSRAEFIQKYFHKGQEIVISGKLHTESWETDDGSKRSKQCQTVDDAHFCGPKQADTVPNVTYSEPDFSTLEGDDSDLPF